MELATSPGSIKEIATFTMMPNTMPVRLGIIALKTRLPTETSRQALP
jgi:hypothetical protein